MAHYSKLFSKVPVAVQNLSGFDLSHENLFTAKCGTLTPCFVQPCIPNTKISLGVSAEIQLPPMSTSFYGKIDAVFEAFFVPYRQLYGGWEELITHPVNNAVYPSGVPSGDKAKYLPTMAMSSGYGAGSLSDYLGMKIDGTGAVTILNPFFHLAYHWIWNHWYRNSFVQQPCFSRNATSATAGLLPWASYGGNSPTGVSTVLADGKSCTALRQRNWAKDYFTNSTPLPQAGTQATLSLGLTVPDPSDASTATAEFSWGELSAMNSLQRFMQRNNIAGYRYVDQILARFGVLPPDAIMDRPQYLGRKIVPVYTKSVYQQSGTPGESTNPFKTIGAKYGSPLGVGSGNLINRFHAKEHGVFMVLFSLVPRAYYSTGTSRHFLAQTMADFPDPDFAHMGDQPIYQSELINSFVTTQSSFGYSQKDSHYKYIDDQVHGLLRDGQSLASFALQRSFATAPSLGTSFLEIPQDFLDQVTAVGSSVSDYGCWVDAYFNCKVSQPLPAYSIATLTDPKDVHTVMVDKSGRTL